MITSLGTRLNQYNPLCSAWVFGLAVLLTLPALLFSNLMPNWTPQVALSGLILILLLRALAAGSLTGQPAIDAALLLLLAWLPFTVWASTDPAASGPLAYAFVGNLAIFWAIAAQQQPVWLSRSGWLLLLGAVALTVVLLLGTQMNSAKLPFIDRSIYDLLPGDWRAFWDREGFNPNLSGGLLAMIWLPVALLAGAAPAWQQRDLAKGVALLVGALLLLTQSRGALLAAAVALIVVTALSQRRWLVGWGVLLTLLLGVAIWAGPAVIVNQTLGNANTLAGRGELWQRAVAVMAAHPLTGAGLGQVKPALIAVAPVEGDQAIYGLHHAHNIWLQAGAELGLPGLLAQGVIWLTLLVMLWRAARRSSPAYRALTLGMLGSMIVFLGHGMFDAITASPRVALIVWALFGYMFAIAQRVNAESDD